MTILKLIAILASLSAMNWEDVDPKDYPIEEETHEKNQINLTE